MIRWILFVLMSVSAFAADPTQETVTVAPSGGTYTSLNAWEAGEDDTGDLVSSNVFHVVKIQGSWTTNDSNAVSISGWTTDATRYICVTNDTSKHDGKSFKSSSTSYAIEVSDARAMLISEDYVRIYGLQIKSSSVTADRNLIELSVGAANAIYIGYCIFTGSSSADGAGITAINMTDADGIYTIFNCIGHNIASQDSADGSFITAAGGTVNVYNCTGFKNYRDYYRTVATASSYNCISQDTLSAANSWVGTWSGDYNVCTTGDDPPGSNPADQTVDVTFVSETGTLDLHLAAADSSGVKDATSDQSSGLFADDIDYVTRTGSWDIGADEYVATTTSGGRVIIVTTQ